MQLSFSRRKVAGPAHHSRRRAPERRRLWFDALEDRRLLAVSVPGSSFEAPGSSTGVAFTGSHSVAMDNTGNAVVAWLDSTTSNSSGPTAPYNLDFQLYNNSSGTLAAGASGTVASDNTVWGASAVGESVAVARAPTFGSTSTQGSNFVVVWWAEGVSYLNGSPYTSYATFARLYNGAGMPLTGAIQVGGSGADNGWASVAMNDNGFDVAYGSYAVTKHSVSGTPIVTVQQYNMSGAAVGKPISVADTHQSGAIDSLSMDPAGNFVVAWNQSTNVGTARNPNWVTTIDAQRYTAAGSTQGSLLQLNTSGGLSVAMDSSDDYVLAWYDGGGDGGGLITQTIYATGAQGALNHVGSAGAPFGVIGPSIAMQAGGNYAVAWTVGSSSVMADTFLLSGAEQQSPFTVYQTTNTYAAQYAAAAIDGAGDLLVEYSGYGPVGGGNPIYTDGGVFGDFFLDPPAPALAPQPGTNSAAGSASPTSPASAATDAIFAAYAYPEDDTIT